MKLECMKEKLKEAIYLTERMTGKNLSLPILSSVLLEAKGQRLTLKATNLDIGVEVELPVKVEEEGSVAVNAGVLSSFLGNLAKEEKVSLEAVNDNIHVSTPYSSTLIKSFPPDDFPTIPQVQDGVAFALSPADLIVGLKSVAYAAAVSDIKPEISSVYAYQDEGSLVFVATDSFRLAEKRIPFKGGQDSVSMIIPLKNIAEIVRVFEGRPAEIAVQTNRNQVSFYADGIHFTSRLIDGVYPDYRQIMPATFKTEITIARGELMQALKLANIFSDRFSQISLKVSPHEKLLQISSRNQDVGENTVKLDASLGGEDIEMNFNGKYILDCFQSVGSDTVSLRFTERNRPLLVQGSGDTAFRYIVMPVNR